MSSWIDLFNGRDLSGWQGLGGVEHEWQVAGALPLLSDDPGHFEIQAGEGVLVNGKAGKTANLLTEQVFGDCELHLEFVMAKGSNSGVYFMGHYEIQVFDSWEAEELKYSSCGGIYCRWINQQPVGGTPPRVNASRAPGEWQSYDVIFRAPQFNDGGEKVSNGRFEKVVWNGEVVHENVEVEGSTRAAMDGPEQALGPLMVQGDHGPVGYRNIRLKEI
ncbi:MAG: DUF1080 domain-containing protein [bacterium]|nr:DUF1080 domain-containing protein [bacterium]